MVNGNALCPYFSGTHSARSSGPLSVIKDGTASLPRLRTELRRVRGYVDQRSKSMRCAPLESSVVRIFAVLIELRTGNSVEVGLESLESIHGKACPFG